MRHFLFVFFTILSFFSYSQLPNHIPEQGLVAWWPLDGNVNDLSGNNNNGINYGALSSTDRFGNENAALLFNGSTAQNSNNTNVLNDCYLHIPNFYTSFTDEITISFWINYTDNNQSPSGGHPVLVKRNSNTIDFDVSLGTNNNFSSHLGSAGSFGDATYLPFNTWHHLALVYDGYNYKLFIDGVLSSHYTSSGALSNNWSDLYIGRYIYYGGLTHYFYLNGKLDDVAIWSRALLDEEINTLYSLECSQVDTSFTEETACESYEWNGNTYTESGTYEYPGLENHNNYSMSFDGVDDVVDFNHSSSLSIDNNISISFDIKINEIQDFYQEIITHSTWGESNETNSLYFLEINPENNKLNYLHEYDNGINEIVELDFDFTTNTWYNIVVTRNVQTKEIKFFINGTLEQTSSYINNPDGGSYGKLNIGWQDQSNCYGDGTPCHFSGYLDRVHIWETILTDQKIQDYVNCSPSGNEEGLVGYWNFEEGEGNTVYDLSGNGNDGIISDASFSSDVPEQSCQLTTANGCDSVAVLNLTITQPDTSFTEVTACQSYEWNGETYTESGTYEYSIQELENEYSMSFDGENDNIEINEISAYETNIHTVSLWYYSSDVSPGDLLSKDGESIGRQWLLQIATQSDKIQTHVWTTDGLYSSFSNIELENNTWYYLTQVWNGNTLKLYINGELDNSIETSGELVEGNQPIRIGGGSVSGTTLYSKAVLDNIEIWEVELTQNEIIENMYCSPIGIEDGLAGYWSFEDGSENTVIDQTSNGNDGTINGATYNANVPEQSCQLTTVNDCDSLAVLNLTITQPDTSSTEVIACESYQWNGQTYTESGTYSYSGNSASNNYSMSFDQNQNSIINIPPFQQNSNELTVMANIFVEDNDYSNDSEVIIGQQYGFFLLLCDQGLQGELYNQQGDWEPWTTDPQYDLNPIMPIINEWNHVAFTTDSDSLYLYLNGLLVFSAPTYNLNIQDDYPICIGGTNSNGTWANRYFSGLIDNACIFERKLSGQEIFEFSMCPPTENESGLVGYWNFEEGEGETVIDLSENGNNGTNNGATYSTDVPEQSCQLTSLNGCDSVAVLDLTITQPDTSFTEVTACESYEWNGQTYNESGIYDYIEQDVENNYSINFKGGDDYINIGRPLNLYSSDEATFSLWFNTSSDVSYVGSFISNDTQPTNPEFNFGLNGGKVITSGGPSSVNPPLVQTSTSYNDGEWHHALVTKSSNCLSLYVDGQFIETDCSSSGNMDTGDDYYIGDNRSHGSWDYIGYLDEIKIFNRVLNDEEIIDLYTLNNDSISGLITYYDFNEGLGFTVNDQISGFDGTLFNMLESDWSTETPQFQSNPDNCNTINVLSLIIEEIDTSFTEATACESYEWNGQTYTESGIYQFATQENEHSIDLTSSDSYIDFGDNINPTSQLTLMGWINISDEYDQRTFIEKCDNNDNKLFLLGKDAYANSIGFILDIDGQDYSISGSLNNWNSSLPFPDEEWHHIAATYDGQTMKIYTDGVLDNMQQDVVGSLPISDANTYFGDPVGGGGLSKSLFNNFSIWDIALTQEQIQSYMNCPPTGNEDDLVGYWNFEEGEGNTAYDLSGNGNDGTIIGATYSTDVPEQSCQLTTVNGCDSVAVLNLTITEPDTSIISVITCESYQWNGEIYTENGIYEYSEQNDNELSMSFDGTDNHISANMTSFNIINDMSICFWLKTNSESYSRLINKDCNNCQQGEWKIDLESNGNLLFEIEQGGGSASSSLNSISVVNDGNYYFISCTRNNLTGETKLFVNGLLEDSNISENNIYTITNTFPLFFGGINSGYNYYDGKIDEVHIWNTTLTQQQIQQYMTCPPSGNEEGLVGYWDFEEGEGNTVYDLSGNGNDGIINGATYSADVPEQSCQLTTVNGCVSVAVLNLTITEPDTSITSVTTCESYQWNGQTYYETGIYYFISQNSSGCDSIITLDLTIDICGCTDSTAFNYDADATADDGSCIAAVFGCLDSLANNYNELANTENGSCIYEVYGCIDESACNYDASANTDDGSCNYLEVEYTINNNSCPNDEVGYIFVSPISGVAPYLYSWSNGGNNSFLMNLSSGEYILDITDASGCQLTDTIVLEQPTSELENITAEICYITVDDASGKNKIVINPIQLESIGGYVISKEVLTGVYQSIATLDANTTEFVDETSNPLVNSDRYKVTALDNCLSSSIESDFHQTVHLSMNIGLNSSVNLDWDQYEGFEVSSYMVFRGESVNNLSFIGFVSGNQTSYTDLNPPTGTSIYQVRVVAPICNPISSNPNASFAQLADTLRSNIVEHDYVEENDNLGVNIIANNPSCSSCTDGSLIANAFGGTPSYTYTWSNGIYSNFNFNLSEGSYTLYVLDSQGGIYSETITLTAESSDVLGCTDSEATNYNADATQDDGSCEYPLDPCDIIPTGMYVDNIIHNRINFNWSAPASAPSFYMIRYRPVGTSGWTVMTAGPQNDVPFTGTSRTRYFMQPATTYQWNIRARVVDENGATICQSPWSASHEYTTLPECENMQNLSVSTEANWVRFNADAPSGDWGIWLSKGKIKELGSNSFRYINGNDVINTLKGNFTASTDYQWHTKAWCTANVDNNGNADPQYHSGWGDFSSFRTEDICDKLPVNLSTQGINQSISNILTMSWDTPISGQPDHYFLELNNETSGQTWQWNNIPGSSNSKSKYNLTEGEYSWRIRGACGTNGTSWATDFTEPVYYTLGGQRLENSTLANLNVYPNPSRGEFNISFDLENRQDVYISITNYLGEVLFTEELKEQEGQYSKSIDLGNKANGIYMLNITTNNQNINQKIVIQ